MTSQSPAQPATTPAGWSCAVPPETLGYLWPPECPRTFTPPPGFAPIPRSAAPFPGQPGAFWLELDEGAGLSPLVPEQPPQPPAEYISPDIIQGQGTRAYELCRGATRPPLVPGWGAPVLAGPLESPGTLDTPDASAGQGLQLRAFAATYTG